MLRKLIGLSALALTLVPVASVNAQDEDFPGLDAGTWELTLTGSGSSNEDLDTGDFNINGSIGYFVLDQFEVLFRQSVGYIDVDNVEGGGTSVVASSAVAADYHFDLDRWQPFVGVNFGYSYGDSDVDETLYAGPEAGLKYFVKDDTFLYGLVQYQFFFENSEQFEDNFDDGNFLYAIGIGFTW